MEAAQQQQTETHLASFVYLGYIQPLQPHIITTQNKQPLEPFRQLQRVLSGINRGLGVGFFFPFSSVAAAAVKTAQTFVWLFFFPLKEILLDKMEEEQQPEVAIKGMWGFKIP